MKPSNLPTAFSYIRFSHPSQVKGDSLRRQTEAAAAWCARNAVHLDATTTLHDLGKSAYTGAHRKNPDRHALAAFLKLVEQGRVPRGSHLIIEALDRLSREHIQPALMLLLNLLQSGVRVVQLSPVESVYDDKSDAMHIMLAVVELSRGHSESAMKSERVGKAWDRKRELARTDGTVLMPKNLPAWVECRGGKLHLIPGRAKAVRRVFDLAAAGYGAMLICKKLTAEKVPAIGGTGRWVRSYVTLLLNDRRVVGEYQPQSYKSGKREPVGEPIPNYLPAAVTEQEWTLARAGAETRKTFRGRVGRDFVNVFAGLLTSARDGSAYYADRHRGVPSLHNLSSNQGKGRLFSFPYQPFEDKFLDRLREIDPCEVIGADHLPDELRVREAELTRTESEIAALEAELERGDDIPAVVRVLRRKEQLRGELAADVDRLRQKAANPLASSWGEAQTLAAVVATAPDPHDARIRLRAALRRIVTEARLLVVSRGHTRLAAVQFYFVGGAHRDYLIAHKAAHGASGSPARTGRPRSLVLPGKSGEMDLRRPADVAALERQLTKLGDAELDKLLAGPDGQQPTGGAKP